MKFNGKRIGQQKFWEEFVAPEIEDIEDLYEKFSDNLIRENVYSEDAWCYVQDFGDGILVRSFLIRRSRRKHTRKGETYYTMGDLICNREVNRMFIAKDGTITQCVNGYHFVVCQGLLYNNYNWAWEHKKLQTYHSSYWSTLDIPFGIENIVLGKIDNCKYVFEYVLDYVTKENSNKDKYFNLSDLCTFIGKYLKNPLYEVAYKLGEFGDIPNDKRVTPKMIANSIKYKVFDRLDVMLECNSTDYEAFQKITCYHWNDIKQFYKEHFENLFPKFIDFMIKCAKYRNGFSGTTYNDYLHNLVDLNIELTEENLFNKQFEKEHSRMSKRLQEIKNKSKFDGYKKFADKNHNFKFMNIINDEKYEVIVPTDLHQFVEEAEQNSNCVYANGYYKKFAKANCIIIFVRKKEDINHSYLTVEIGKDYEVLQCYQKHNAVADYEGKSFVMNVAEIYKQNQVFNKLEPVNIE